MMSFDDDFPHQTLFDCFGKAATFIGAGGAVATLVVVDDDIDLEPVGVQSQIVENQTIINLLTADVGEPVRGDTIQIDATIHTIDAVVFNDQYVIRVAVI